MNLKIRRFRDRGDLSGERIVLVSSEDMDVGKYLLLKSRTVNKDEVSTDLKDCFWLPDLSISAGDLVVIYSKAGQNRSKEYGDGSKSHFMYRGLKSAIWGDDADCAVLMEISSWSMKETKAEQ